MTNLELSLLAAKTLSNKKAEDVLLIDIQEKATFADYFVICSGNSERQVEALADEVEFQLGSEIEHEVGYHKEGYGSAEWILLDYKDVIVHIFCGETRDFYNIEHLWSDGTEVDINEFLD
ncbi:MAG: ribosome silencing factor [Clostridia bacterium]|nr:ribosome silencing factor [Clostridia bacterium]